MIIGLTGSIATGKSTVAAYLLSKGYPVVDLDKIARLVVEKGQATLDKIASVFGEEVLLSSGELNRGALGQIVFSDEQARLKLNEITHPAIQAEMYRQIEAYKASGAQIIFCDVPLLYEGDLGENFDAIWVVYVPETLQLERLMARESIDQETAKSRMATQLSIESKKAFADVVIDNSFTKEKTYEEIDRQLEAIRLC
jgi:dephospho-CoA kinase